MYDHMVFSRSPRLVDPGVDSGVPVMDLTSPGQIKTEIEDEIFSTLVKISLSRWKYMYFGSIFPRSSWLILRLVSVFLVMIMTESITNPRINFPVSKYMYPVSVSYPVTPGMSCPRKTCPSHPTPQSTRAPPAIQPRKQHPGHPWTFPSPQKPTRTRIGAERAHVNTARINLITFSLGFGTRATPCAARSSWTIALIHLV